MEKFDISFVGEFGYEMILSVPYAYWLYNNDILGKTTSSKDTKCFYYFNNFHEETYESRKGYLYDREYGGNNLNGNPNKTIHTYDLDTTKFIMPPYKKIYKNNIFLYDKPMIMVSNKYYSTGRNENRHLNLEMLETLFDILSNKFIVIYNRAASDNIVNDQNLVDENFNDFKLIKKINNPNIVDINVLYKQYKSMFSFNTFQCLLKANCESYISVQGGTSIFSSLFGGTNIIYANDGMELKFNSYSWYNKFSNANIVHTKTYDELISNVSKL